MKTLLVVDDEKLIADGLRAMLAQAFADRVRVMCCYSAREATALVAENPPENSHFWRVGDRKVCFTIGSICTFFCQRRISFMRATFVSEISLACTDPLPRSFSARCRAFPPGAAHTSMHASPQLGAATSATIMELISCTWIQPFLKAPTACR